MAKEFMVVCMEKEPNCVTVLTSKARKVKNLKVKHFEESNMEIHLVKFKTQRTQA